MINDHCPLAIIGMACHLPGARNLKEFWKLIYEGQSAITKIPSDKTDFDIFFSPKKGERGKTYMDLVGQIEYQAFNFSNCRYPIHHVESLDVLHLEMCQTAAWACRHAGMNPFRLPLRHAGVYVGGTICGRLGGDLVYSVLAEHLVRCVRDVEELRRMPPEEREAVLAEVVAEIRVKAPFLGPGGTPTAKLQLTAGAVSDSLGLDGPATVVDAACSSSLQSLAIAARDLRMGNVDMAIVGGASYLSVGSLILFSAAQSGSATGSCPFSDNADGLIPAEGSVCVILKTLDRALADGDPIQAVVKNISVSSDGKGKSLWAPQSEGQCEAIINAYPDAGDMNRVAYLEAHATSTAVGDQVELRAMEMAFSGKFTNGKKRPIGGVKANIGHALEAAGLAGLLKAVLVMQHNTVPQQIACLPLSKKVDWEKLPFFVPEQRQTLMPSVDGRARLVGVNSFGIGGLNVHVSLEEALPGLTRPTRVAAAGMPEKEVSREPVLKCGGGGKYAVEVTPENVVYREAVAVIGVGTVFPGGRTLADFERSVFNGENPKTEVPPERWSQEIGFCCHPDEFHTDARTGGFVKGFEYDWRRHRIPPKQLASGDPLQFMILDGTDAALADAGYDKKEFNHLRCCVLVGSSFDNDFGHDLGMGFSVSHTQHVLCQVLKRHGMTDDAENQKICEKYAENFYKKYPAILDETGSFTPSSLSSRVLKTYNIRGGAMSIEAGDTAGLAVVADAMNILRTGEKDMVICAAGARLMGLPAYIQMSLAGETPADGGDSTSGLSAADAGNLPAEGAGVLVLKRLSDAVRDGDRIRAVIHGVGCAGVPENKDEQKVREAYGRAIRRAWGEPADASGHGKKTLAAVELSGAPREVLGCELAALAEHYAGNAGRPIPVGETRAQFGHLRSAGGMASLVKGITEINEGKMPALYGFREPGELAKKYEGTFFTPVKETPLAGGEGASGMMAVSVWNPQGFVYHAIFERYRPGMETEPCARQRVAEKEKTSDYRVVCLEAGSYAELKEVISRAVPEAEKLFREAGNGRAGFSRKAAENRVRMAVVAADGAELAEKLREAVDVLEGPHAELILQRRGIFVGTPTENPGKVAFLFPGLGSQYAEMLRGLTERFAPVREAAAKMNEILVKMGLPTFEDLTISGGDMLETDVFRAQLSLLCADTLMWHGLHAVGIRPDVVSSHSHGEFPAMRACGVWDFENAVLATKIRCETILRCEDAAGGMLSTNVDGAEAERICALFPGEVFPANYNAPDQTVLGGKAKTLEKIAEILKADGKMVKIIPVQRPFHTPLMASTESILYEGMGAVRFQQPIIPVLSSVTNQYVRNGEEIRKNLAAQMCRPIRFVELIRTLAAQGVTLFVECGPKRVLTSLAANILGDSPAKCWAADDPQKNDGYQLMCLRAWYETHGYAEREATEKKTSDYRVVCLEAGSDAELKEAVSRAVPEAEQLFRDSVTAAGNVAKRSDRIEVENRSEELSGHCAGATFPAAVFQLKTLSKADISQKAAGNRVRMAVVAADGAELAEKLREAAEALDGPHAEIVLQRKGIFVGTLTENPGKVAFLFSGQGSQYAGMLRGLTEWFAPVREAAAKMNEILVKMGLPTFEDLTISCGEQLGTDVFRTQLSLLCADTLMWHGLHAVGIRPDVVSSHSYGEFPAMYACGVWDFENAVLATKIRCETILRCEDAAGGMLSTNLGGAEAERICASFPGEVFPANYNAPDQTVLGGKMETLEKIAEILKADGKMAKIIPVPRPFHTPLMASTENILYEGLGAVCFQQPIIPVLSSVTNQYVRNGEEIRKNLAAQMCRPIRFVELIRTLAAQGVTLFVECGPKRVLTSLAANILNGSPVKCWAADDPQKDDGYQLMCLRAWYETHGYAERAKTGDSAAAKKEVMARILELADAADGSSKTVSAVVTPEVTAQAAFLGVLPETVLALQAAGGSVSLKPTTDEVEPSLLVTNAEFQKRFRDSSPPQAGWGKAERKCCRFEPRLMESPLPAYDPRYLKRGGHSLIYGDNPVARMLERKLTALGRKVTVLGCTGDWERDGKKAAEICEGEPCLNLFLTAVYDAGCRDDHTLRAWAKQREMVLGTYTVTQSWFRGVQKNNGLKEASVCAVTRLGGDYGFSGNVHGRADGAICGLLKSLYLEVGLRTDFAFRAPCVDFSEKETPEGCAEKVLATLAANIPYEVESGWIGGKRYITRLMPAAVKEDTAAKIPAGAWIVTGGGRGITAFTAKHLAAKYGLTIHVIGSSPAPEIDPSWRNLDEAGLKKLREEITKRAASEKRNPLAEWRRVDRALKLDTTLRGYADAGVKMVYHHCDMTDSALLGKTVDAIRAAGPITGILHGAGIEISAGFEKKNMQNVEKTWSVKADGLVNLLELTKNDPLTHVLGFGSTAGRQGSVGQTDYSMANDAISKILDLYARQHPECRVSCFHWDPWDEIGMAVRPEVMRSPILRNLVFMPPGEGLAYVMEELTAKAPVEKVIAGWEPIQWYYLPEADAAETPTGTAPEEPVEKTAEKAGERFGSRIRETKSAPVEKTAERIEEPSPEKAPPEEASVSSDYLMRRMEPVMIPAGAWVEKPWKFTGSAIIYGDNADSRALRSALNRRGVETLMLPETELPLPDAKNPPAPLLREMESFCEKGPAPHLFIMSGRNPEGLETADSAACQYRRRVGFMTPKQICRQWLRRMTKDGLLGQATLAAGVLLGGDCGFSGEEISAEGGAVSGLLKSIHVENGGPERDGLTVRIVDAPRDTDPAVFAEAVLAEFNTPDIGLERCLKDGKRMVPRVRPVPAQTYPREEIRRGGTWVFTGGGRGITAETARVLGEKYGLKVNLLGSSPVPALDESIRYLSDEELVPLKRQVVKEGLRKGISPDKTWGSLRKALEIDRNVRKMRSAGLEVEYYQCDVTDPRQAASVLEAIRRKHGPIHGVIHGAGIDGNQVTVRDAPDSVAVTDEKVTAVKAEAVVTLWNLLKDDPLDYFVGFGSISGRFGAAGLGNYAAGNEMLCKYFDAFRRERPESRIFAVHWHGWGEIGMMTRPVGYGSVKILKMRLMLPEEGIAHLENELSRRTGCGEIIVTDPQYYTLFWGAEMALEENHHPVLTGTPPESVSFTEDSGTAAGNVAKRSDRIALENRSEVLSGHCAGASFPAAVPQLKTHSEEGNSPALVDSVERISDTEVLGRAVMLPAEAPFLRDHCLRQRPLLPTVITSEMFCETARRGERMVTGEENSQVTGITGLSFMEGLRFLSDSPQEVRVKAVRKSVGVWECRLTADFYNTKGKLMLADRLYSQADVLTAPVRPWLSTDLTPQVVPEAEWYPAGYLPPEGTMYHGPVFQQLQRFAFLKENSEVGCWGEVKILPLAEFAGVYGTRGWEIPASTLDTCMFLCGVFVWCFARGKLALPKTLGRISLGYGQLREGSRGMIHCRVKEIRQDEVVFRFALFNESGEVVLTGDDYCCSIISDTSAAW